MKIFALTILIIPLSASSVFARECNAPHVITKEDISAAQKAWGDSIVAIGAAKDPKKTAMERIDLLYAYDIGPVLFKPTKAALVEFRPTKEEALSYFVGGKEQEDKGFALAPFTQVRFDNKGTILGCDHALAMGNYYFTTADGKNIKVDYSFSYMEDQEGRLKINLHHSSLPYTPQ